ncbi:hypothetical protein OHB12_04640 [Nocardia sp. NBC_01730]|uniref:hypothetical protein n=1 Tax=Nocardia sp. NBC_01730 TaxID=2975998 RepID=UPI002E16575C|nr:hypothetical protein OHB12_04640 [Nocardia sp. NBC_01730]
MINTISTSRRAVRLICHWTVDEFLGVLWSTSYTARIRQDPALAEEFEKDLRAQLLGCEPSGQRQESIAHYYILGHKPDQSGE